MIILSKLADYAVIIATQLAAASPRQASTAQLAAETRLPGTTVAKVLKRLARAGIVTAARGAAGGYRLAQPPEEIKVADVVAAIDGGFAMTECTSHAGPCQRTEYCGTRPHWAVINRAVEAALDRVTLAEMSRPFSAVTFPQRLAVQEARP